MRSRRIALGVAFIGMIITWAGFAAYWGGLALSAGWVTPTRQTMNKLQAVEAMMDSAESDVYAYVITDSHERLDAFEYARTMIPRRLGEIDGRLIEGSRPKKIMRRLRQIITDHLTFLEHVVTARRTDGYQAAGRWVANADDAPVRIKRLFSDLEHGETPGIHAVGTTQPSVREKGLLLVLAGICLGFFAWFFGLLRQESGERRVIENANETLEFFLRSMVERIPYMITVKEATNLRFILVNKAATEWLGRTEAELLGSNEFDISPRESARLAIQRDREALGAGRPIDIPEEPLIHKGKEERILHTQKVVIPDSNGRPAYLLSISEDITQRKQAERLLELSRDTAVQSERLKSEFIRNMSHEIRTPLAIVVGMVSLILDTELTTEQKHFATKAKNAADNLSKLAKDILTFSRIESGTFALEMRDMNVRKNVEDVIGMFSEQAKAKGIGLVCLMSNDIPATLLGDAVRVRQILSQLIGNAVKFTARGEVIVRVAQSQSTDAQVGLTYKISDTGIGIPVEAQQYLFEPFRQGDGSPTRKFGGTGLGLAMSKRLVELMGGEIGFESVAGQGSTFWIKLPLQKRPAAGLVSPAISEPWTKSRILVVDENETIRQSLRQQLTSWGMGCELAASGESALELLRREKKAGRPFGIALVDMHLSDMESIAFARVVKDDPDLRSMHLLVMSDAPLESATTAPLGFSAWVLKPPKPEALHERLATLIESAENAKHHAA